MSKTTELFQKYLSFLRPDVKPGTVEWHTLFLIWLDGYQSGLSVWFEHDSDKPAMAGEAAHEKLGSELKLSCALDLEADPDRPVGLRIVEAGMTGPFGTGL